MSQLNIHVTTSFEKDLNKYMKLKHIETKSEAIRIAIKEGILHAAARIKPIDFSGWLGLGLQVPVNKKTKFSSDDDIWK
jgi:hypothetical protein